MSKYTDTDFMPKDPNPENGIDEPQTTSHPEAETGSATESELNSEPGLGQADSPEPVLDPEVGLASRTPVVPRWARFVSSAFSPLLIPTYCTVLAMWITPLSAVPEDIRFRATLVVLLLSAVAPMAYVLALVKLKRVPDMNFAERSKRIAPSVISIAGMALSGLYMYYACAPVWLVMIFVAAITNTVVYLLFNSFTEISGHASAMGLLTAVVYYIGAANIGAVSITPWVIGTVIFSGLVCSARMATGNCRLRSVAIGYSVGIAVGYTLLHLRFFDQLTRIY